MTTPTNPSNNLTRAARLQARLTADRGDISVRTAALLCVGTAAPGFRCGLDDGCTWDLDAGVAYWAESPAAPGQVGDER